MKIELKYVLIWGLVFSSLTCILGLSIGDSRGYQRGVKHKTIIVHTEFDVKPNEPENSSRYPFLRNDISSYICSLAEELRFDPDLYVAHLMVENPKFDPEAVHRNDNGTMDLGLTQLNDRYIYSVFVPNYWDMNIEFNPFNWKHNIFLAMHYMKDLSESVKVQDDAIMAYNCGLGTVMNNKIPGSTYSYLASVKNNYSLLKEMHEESK